MAPSALKSKKSSSVLEQMDDATGAKQVYLCRNSDGVPSGSAVVGLVSVDEALRIQVSPNLHRYHGSVLPSEYSASAMDDSYMLLLRLFVFGL